MQDQSIVIAPKSKIHGHALIISFSEYILSVIKDKSLSVIEVGSERGSGSTYKLSKWANKNNFKFISVDADKDNSENAGAMVKTINQSFEAHHRLGEEFLNDYKQPEIGVLYLDAFDLVTDWPHIEKTINSYKTRKADLTNEMAYKMHYDATVNSYKKVVPGGFICFDDVWLDEKNVWQGKGKTAIPFLLNNGYKLIYYRPNSALFQNMNGFTQKENSFAFLKGKIAAVTYYYKNKLLPA